MIFVINYVILNYKLPAKFILLWVYKMGKGTPPSPSLNPHSYEGYVSVPNNTIEVSFLKAVKSSKNSNFIIKTKTLNRKLSFLVKIAIIFY